MAPKFGTSGLRGLVVDLTPELVTQYVQAFIRACPMGTGLYVARDLRASSPSISELVVQAATDAGLDVTDCGEVPTPALALASMQAGAAAIMVTGSHIPADRNGLKFYLPQGEIAKSDETAILANLSGVLRPAAKGSYHVNRGAGADWCARYVTAFGRDALAGMRIGVWSHSAVSRDFLITTLQNLGAEVVEKGRSDSFVPVDTEAVPQDVRDQLADWIREFGLDAIVSTDGDGDRPLMADDTGRVVPGDILGQITATVLKAGTVVTPVNSNTGVDQKGGFDRVIRTKIGSPFVIAAMEENGGSVVGYEANGGFLLGFDASLSGGRLTELATRDSLLPLIAPLTAAKAAGGLAALVALEPQRFTAADRLEDIPTDRSNQLISSFKSSAETLAHFLSALGEERASSDETDGLRITCISGRIVHFRPSGNAPEFRFYAEAESREAATELLGAGLRVLQKALQA